MKTVHIIFWSGTGNTAAMASAIAEGVKEAGAQAELISVENATADMLTEEKSFALGCPSMGAEQLEESVMEPFMCELDNSISGKEIALFGSYGWGDGQWMRDWEERINADGAVVLDGEGLIANNTPSESDLDKCRAMGRSLAR